MAGVILPSEIEYQPFTDDQISSFSKAAGVEYASQGLSWRAELDDAAKELLIEYGSKNWPTPSALRRQLVAVKNKPDKFIQSLADDAELRDTPIATAILHGARWGHSEGLATAADHRDEFIAGVEREIKWLDSIISKRKGEKIAGHGGDAAMDAFIDRLAWIYQDAFLAEPHVGLIVHDDEPSGPFIGFARKVLVEVEINLPTAYQGNGLPAKLRAIANSGYAIRRLLEKSPCYKTRSPAERGRPARKTVVAKCR